MTKTEKQNELIIKEVQSSTKQKEKLLLAFDRLIEKLYVDLEVA